MEVTIELPKIILPGDKRLQSYRTALNDYCMIKNFPAPEYTVEEREDGKVGIVSFNNTSVRSEETMPNEYLAYIRAAFEALKQIGYLRGHTFVKKPNALKREDGVTFRDMKHVKDKLNRVAAFKQLGTPTYKKVTHPDGFCCVVSVGGQEYRSMGIYQEAVEKWDPANMRAIERKKAKKNLRIKAYAERDAAQVAIDSICPGPLIPAKTGECSCLGGMFRYLKGYDQFNNNAKTELPKIVTKRLGQPTYETVDVDQGYRSTVTFGTVETKLYQFQSTSVSSNKKSAECDAAQVAIDSMRQCTCMNETQDLSRGSESLDQSDQP